MMNNQDFISGIYNYCDRWCERCQFTTRCANFSLIDDNFPTPEDRDINNKKFWDNLHNVFQTTFNMLADEMEKRGIDIITLDLENTKKRENKLKKITQSNECVKTAKKYSETVTLWLEQNNDLFKQKAENLQLQVNLELPNTNPDEDATEITDASEIITWYQYQIYVKLTRAIRSKAEEKQEPEDDYPKDSNGSAKVALIGIDRSIAAWSTIRDHFPDQEDSILDILIELNRLRNSAEQIFPNARAFIRAGFDN